MDRSSTPRRQSTATPPEVVEQIETGSVEDLAEVTVPTLIIPGTDSRHPTALGATLARVLPAGQLSEARVSSDLHNADDLAVAVAPAIREGGGAPWRGWLPTPGGLQETARICPKQSLELGEDE